MEPLHEYRCRFQQLYIGACLLEVIGLLRLKSISAGKTLLLILTLDTMKHVYHFYADVLKGLEP